MDSVKLRRLLGGLFTLALIIASVTAPSISRAQTPVSIYDIQFTTDPSGDSPYAGQTVTTQGTVTGVFSGGSFVWIQDGTGAWSGLLLFEPAGTPAVGDRVEVTGLIEEYFGMTELTGGTVTVLSSGNPLPAAELLDTGSVSQEQWESVFVRVEDAVVTDGDIGFGEWVVDDSSGPVVVDDLGSYSYNPATGDIVAFLQGPLNYSFGAFKIEPRDDGDISAAAPPPLAVTIMEIQGAEQFSPYAGQVVETDGVVTLFTANGAHCWLQDRDGDGNPNTSDGIFVDGCGFPDEGLRPVVGDRIRIIAEVDELQFGDALPLTRLTDVTLIEVLTSDSPLPAPVPVNDLPNLSILEAIDFWEPLEGMLVWVDNAPVVGPTSVFGEFAMLTRQDARPGSGYYPQTKQILLRDLDENMVDYNPERILVDDSTLEDAIVVMPGDRVRSLVGAVDYTFGNYKLQPASFEVKQHILPALPVSQRSGPPGDTVVTTFNVENLFDLELNTGAPVDAIGQVGVDPGSEWGTGDTSTRDNTIRRQDAVCTGDNDETDPFDPTVEWNGYPQNTFEGLGNHSVACGTATGLFFSEYVEGSGFNKALEIYNGTGAPVNLGAGAYAIEIYFNGQTSPGTTIQLSGTLADGDVYVVADDDADAAILAVADQTSTANFFNGDDAVVLRTGGKDDAGSTPTPEELETQLSKLALAIELELELPEILVVQEVENTAILQELGNRVNMAAGTDYQAVSFETSDARGIEVGFLWDENRVTLLEAFQLSGPDVEAAFGPSSASPGREPLYGRFQIDDRVVHIVGNHFKSKGGDDPLFGIDWPPDRITEEQRKLQAQVVRDFVNEIFATDPDALVMVAGDLNDFPFGEPGEGENHPLAILEGGPGEVPLTNLITLEKESEEFTYIFDGNSQVLDHILISPKLFDLFVAVDALHFNASYPAALGDEPGTPIRSSDHDPVEGRFYFP